MDHCFLRQHCWPQCEVLPDLSVDVEVFLSSPRTATTRIVPATADRIAPMLAMLDPSLPSETLSLAASVCATFIAVSVFRASATRDDVIGAEDPDATSTLGCGVGLGVLCTVGDGVGNEKSGL